MTDLSHIFSTRLEAQLEDVKRALQAVEKGYKLTRQEQMRMHALGLAVTLYGPRVSMGVGPDPKLVVEAAKHFADFLDGRECQAGGILKPGHIHVGAGTVEVLTDSDEEEARSLGL